MAQKGDSGGAVLGLVGVATVLKRKRSMRSRVSVLESLAPGRAVMGGAKVERNVLLAFLTMLVKVVEF